MYKSNNIRTLLLGEFDSSTAKQAMGYDLHITRKAYWCDETGPEITLDEWISYAQGDKEIQPDPENPGEENWVVMLGANTCPLWWSDTGELYMKNPDDTMITKMISVADSLNARVLGDDDEVYRTAPSGEILIEKR